MYRLTLASCIALLASVTACQKPKRAPPPVQPSTSPASTALDRLVPAVEASDQPIRIPAELVDLDRWLHVQEVREGAEGGWATGSFNPERNKLTIETHDVQQFAIDTHKVPINWERLVILKLDGRNSELKRRKQPLLRFRRDRHGDWVVLER